MAKAKKRVISNNKDVYEKAEDLPEGKKKAYDSILEDFDRQGNNFAMQTFDKSENIFD